MAHKSLLIDTDVCLDLLTGRSPFNHNAQQLFYLAEKGTVKAMVSSVSFSNMFYLISRWESKKRAYTQLSALREIVSVASVDEKEVDLSLKKQWKDFEDALQFHAAVSAGCRAIITRNLADYKESNIPVYSPAEFLEEVR